MDHRAPKAVGVLVDSPQLRKGSLPRQGGALGSRCQNPKRYHRHLLRDLGQAVVVGGVALSRWVGIDGQRADGLMTDRNYTGTLLPLNLAYTSFLVDALVGSFEVDAQAFRRKLEVGQPVFGGQGKVSLRLQPFFRKYLDIEGSYGRIDENDTASTWIYAGERIITPCTLWKRSRPGAIPFRRCGADSAGTPSTSFGAGGSFRRTSGGSVFCRRRVPPCGSDIRRGFALFAPARPGLFRRHWAGYHAGLPARHRTGNCLCQTRCPRSDRRTRFPLRAGAFVLIDIWCPACYIPGYPPPVGTCRSYTTDSSRERGRETVFCSSLSRMRPKGCGKFAISSTGAATKTHFLNLNA